MRWAGQKSSSGRTTYYKALSKGEPYRCTYQFDILMAKRPYSIYSTKSKTCFFFLSPSLAAVSTTGQCRYPLKEYSHCSLHSQANKLHTAFMHIKKRKYMIYDVKTSVVICFACLNMDLNIGFNFLFSNFFCSRISLFYVYYIYSFTTI